MNQSAFAHTLPSQGPKAHEARKSSFNSHEDLSQRKLLHEDLSQLNSSTRISLRAHSSFRPKTVSACPHALLLSGAPPLRPTSFSAPRPFWACLSSLRQSGERTCLLPRQRDRSVIFYIRSKIEGDVVVEAPQNNGECSSSFSRFWRETSPWTCRASIPLVEVVSTRSRWLWAPFDGVAL